MNTEKMSMLPRKHILGVSIIIGCVCLATMVLFGGAFHQIGIEIRASDTISHYLCSGGIIFFTYLVNLLNKEEYSFKRTTTNLRKAWPIYIVYICSIILVFYDMNFTVLPAKISILLGTIIANLSIGLFEEVLLRGLIFNYMKNAWSQKKYGVEMAVFASSILFGSLHIVNLFSDHTLVIATITQIIYAVFAGLYFAVLYLKTRSILLIALLHGLMDFIADIPSVFSNKVSVTQEITLTEGLIEITIMSILAIWGIHELIVMRKSNNNKIQYT